MSPFADPVPAGDRPDVVVAVERICQRAWQLGDVDLQHRIDAIRERLNQPLRVAIAGRVKAGKSTLLNALMGERLAPTDARECTRVVTWYRQGNTYTVEAILRSGEARPLQFERTDSALEINLAGLDIDNIERLVVSWPSSLLTHMTLVDTPGLESLDEHRSLRTRELFGIDDEQPSEVDAVIYLMRHLHSSDRDFLDAFLDRSLACPSPVNAIAVLSRADEIGAGRLDALDSASAIADRYSADARVQALCSTVVPVAALLAETSHTLREDEVRGLRELCRLDPSERELLLVSVNQFCAAGVSPLTISARRELLDRLGLFGVRFCMAALVDNAELTAAELARRLAAASGVDTLTEVLDGQLAPLADALKSRSALVALRDLRNDLAALDQAAAVELEVMIERVESGAHELNELRLLHLVFSGWADLGGEGRREVGRLTRPGDACERLGLPPDTDIAQQRSVALGRIEAWRTRAAHPLTTRVVADACELVARCYEALYARSRPEAR